VHESPAIVYPEVANPLHRSTVTPHAGAVIGSADDLRIILQEDAESASRPTTRGPRRETMAS